MASTTVLTAGSVSSTSGNQKSYTAALTVLTSLFFIWGFITVLNDILVPHLKALFSLNYTQAMLIQFCFFTAYFVVSMPAGILLEKWGYRKVIVTGLSTMAAACVLFYPAAGYQSYTIFLIALFILASGMTILQVAANPYVAILGKPETAASRLNLAQALNSLGTTIAPLFGSMLILSSVERSAEESAKAVQGPYLGLAATLLVIAVVFLLFKLPDIEAGQNTAADDSGNSTTLPEAPNAWAYRHLVLGALAIFVYVGAEVSIGSFLVNYLSQPEIAGLSVEMAGKFVSYYWGGAMVGRFIGSAVQQKVKPQNVLLVNSLLATILVVLTMLTTGSVAMVAILSIGLFNSIMFPTIFTLAINGLGKHTGQGSGVLCAAIVGGAIVPFMQGAIADQIGIHHAFVLPAICYLYIAYYARKGFQPALLRR